MKTVYPTLIKKDTIDYLVYIPDLDAYTEGSSFYDAIEMARDCINLHLTVLEDEKRDIPKPSTNIEAVRKAKEEADEIMDYSDGILTYVDADTEAYRNKMGNEAVKKNCTIPRWLNDRAERRGLNFSRVLQDALIAIVGPK